jgi:hypothetical protein
MPTSTSRGGVHPSGRTPRADATGHHPLDVAKFFTAGLEDYPGLDADTRPAIDRTNALALFPRFAGPREAPQPIS